MISQPIDPRRYPIKVPIIAHDVGRTNDRSTAVVGGHCLPFFGQQLLVQEFRELPVGIYGSQLANELAKIDQNYNRDCLIVADLSNDATYGEVLFDTFGRRVIGVQIGRSGDGMTRQHRRVKNGVIPVYNVGRTFLLELLLAELRNQNIRLPESAEARHTFEQLAALEREHVKIVSSTNALPGSMTILRYRLPCWPGRPSTCISMPGSNRSLMRTGDCRRRQSTTGHRSSDTRNNVARWLRHRGNSPLGARHRQSTGRSLAWSCSAEAGELDCGTRHCPVEDARRHG